MQNHNLRKTRLAMATLENRLFPAFSDVQLAGGRRMLQGWCTPDRVQVLERHDKILVEVTDLSTGATVQESFKKDKVHLIQLRQGTSGNDLFENEVHDKKIHTQTFSKEG